MALPLSGRGATLSSHQTSPQLESSPSPNTGEAPSAWLPLVDRIVAVIGRRHLLAGAELEDFGSWVKTRIIANDYAVIRKFGGRSSMATYLTVVLSRLFIDYRNQEWGRWRPSAAAQRLGPLAVRLERLIYRDGYPVREAIEALRTHQEIDPAELKRVIAAIPPRYSPREVGLESAEPVPSHDAGEFWARERQTALREAEVAIREVVSRLPSEDRVILQMRYWQDASVADIARALSLDQKALYRRLERIRATLQQHLEQAGMRREQIVALMEDGEAA